MKLILVRNETRFRKESKILPACPCALLLWKRCLLAGKQNENDRGGRAKSHGVDAKSTKKAHQNVAF